MAILPSCTDDKLVDNPSNPEDFGDLVEVDLPGVIGINLASTGVMKTRDGETPSFSDGDEAEYLLAPTDKNHFILIYKSGGSENDTPLVVISMSFNEDGEYKIVYEEDKTNRDQSITLTASSALTSKSLTPIFTRIETFSKDILKDNIAYVLLNFDCSIIDKANTTAYISDKNSNVYNLARLTRKQLLTLPVNDYKINVNGTDYFTMANAVYQGALGVGSVDYIINAENVFSTTSTNPNDKTPSQKALEYPAIKAYVERLAVKYTVAFGTPSSIEEVGTADDGAQSLHVFPNVPVNIYDNFIIDNNGYKINSHESKAMVHVIGYGVSNLEKNSYLLKNIPSQNYYSGWNDAVNHRANWSEDFNYNLKVGSYPYTNAQGYPHQFRYALETDTITSLFADNGTGYTYVDPEHYFDDVTVRVNGQNRTTRYYRELGKINNESLNNACVLKYRSFNELMDNFDSNKPFYSLENTYNEPGMEDEAWAWKWGRAPYGVATNFLLLCQLEINGVVKGTTLYRGQNDIFYLYLYDSENGESSKGKGLINSKLDILNQVMLNGGNAGFQIFDGKWDRHERGTKETILDKIAWNENSYVWMSKSEFDAEGKEVSREYKMMEAEDFTLIPAELAGGDGQCLIAPKGRTETEEGIMGLEYHYYIAPFTEEAEFNDPDKKNLAVEISFNHLVGLIHKIIGPVDVFTNGYMYYALPISHNESYFVENNEKKTGDSTTTGQEDSTGSEGSDSTEVQTDPESWKKLGNIGVVRNYWYRITVNGIGSVGTPVHDVEQPIVPVMNVKRSYINMGVQLMKWHNIQQNGVPM